MSHSNNTTMGYGKPRDGVDTRKKDLTVCHLDKISGLGVPAVEQGKKKGGKPVVVHNKVLDEVMKVNEESIAESMALHVKHKNKKMAEYKAIRVVSIDGLQKNGDFTITVDGRAADFHDWKEYARCNSRYIIMSNTEHRAYKRENNSVIVPVWFLKDTDKKKPKLGFGHDLKVGSIVYVHGTSDVYDQSFIGVFTPKIEKEWRDAGFLVD
jgi:hypothetical protein